MINDCSILAIGELLVEFVATAKNTRHRRIAPYMGPYPSGAPAIFIDQAARMGARACIIGAVGEDAFGEVVLARLEADGVDCTHVARSPGHTTGCAFVVYDDSGGREFVFHLADSAAGAFGLSSELERELADSPPAYLHVSGSSLGDERMAGVILAVAEMLRAHGTRISFDPNVRPELLATRSSRARIDSLLAMASVLFPSEEDLAALYPQEAPEAVAGRLVEAGVDAVVLTRGERGCFYRDAQSTLELPALAASCVDPTGAGDCFSATFLALRAQGWPAEAALHCANAAGAMAVTRSGPMEGNSTPQELESWSETMRMGRS